MQRLDGSVDFEDSKNTENDEIIFAKPSEAMSLDQFYKCKDNFKLFKMNRTINL